MRTRTQEDLRILAGAVIVPAVLGLALSVIWWAAGGDGTFYMTVSLPWLPFAVGLLISALLLPALVTLIAMRRHVEQVRRRTVQEQTASRRRLLARLDHEIKNPIQGIRAALADEPSERQRASIDAQSQRLTSLLGDLRKIGEVEHTALELTTIDPAALVEEAVATITGAPGAGERRIAVSLPTAPRPIPAIVGDEDLLFLALVNVLTNAVKYSAPGTRSRCGAAPPMTWWCWRSPTQGAASRPRNWTWCGRSLGGPRRLAPSRAPAWACRWSAPSSNGTAVGPVSTPGSGRAPP